MKKIFVLSLLFIFLTSTAFAGTINLPKTGQTQCYDTSNQECTCTGTGQDGEIQAGVAWPSPRFTDNGDSTMTDNLTGLIWTKDANLSNAPKTWQEALDYVAGMNAGTGNFGYTDWRLPNVNELESLINAKEADTAAWLITQGFVNVHADYDYYWSSTTCAWSTDYAWSVSMLSGQVIVNYDKSYHGYVWPVRGGQDGVSNAPVWKTGQTTSYYRSDDGELGKGVAWPSPRFTNPDGTTPISGDVVVDQLTGLMWAKDANLPNETKTWQEALNYVSTLNSNNYLGYNDWRLPNRKELYSLTDYSRYDPVLPSGHPFTNVPATSANWSSTTCTTLTGLAWIVGIWDGYVQASGKITFGSYYVWPVRGGQIPPPKCSLWEDVIQKYQYYVNDETTWQEVITCYNTYVSGL